MSCPERYESIKFENSTYIYRTCSKIVTISGGSVENNYRRHYNSANYTTHIYKQKRFFFGYTFLFKFNSFSIPDEVMITDQLRAHLKATK